MQIVIDMPPKEFEHFKQFKGKFICDNGYDLIQAIKNGTPLPKGHGRLIDEKVAYKKFYSRCLAKVATEVFTETPTIIEAESEEQE